MEESVNYILFLHEIVLVVESDESLFPGFLEELKVILDVFGQSTCEQPILLIYLAYVFIIYVFELLDHRACCERVHHADFLEVVISCGYRIILALIDHTELLVDSF